MKTKLLNNSLNPVSYKKPNRSWRYVAAIAAVFLLALPQSMRAEESFVIGYATSLGSLSPYYDGTAIQNKTVNNTDVFNWPNTRNAAASNYNTYKSKLAEKEITFSSTQNNNDIFLFTMGLQPSSNQTSSQSVTYSAPEGVYFSTKTTFRFAASASNTAYFTYSTGGTATAATNSGNTEVSGDNVYTDAKVSVRNTTSASSYHIGVWCPITTPVNKFHIAQLKTNSSSNVRICNQWFFFKIPEVRPQSAQDQTTIRIGDNLAYAEVVPQSVTIKVSDGVDASDFKATITNSGTGTFSTPSLSLNAAGTELTISFNYTAGSTDDNIVANMTVGSINGLNNTSCTIAFGGSVGSAKLGNTLAWNIAPQQYINSEYTISEYLKDRVNYDDDVIITTSDASICEIIDGGSKIKFKNEGPVTLTFSQVEGEEYEAAPATPRTFTVSKRTATFSAVQTTLLTETTYNNNIIVPQDVNHNLLSKLTYSVSSDYMTVANGDITTNNKAGNSITLNMTYDGDAEWNAVNASLTFTIKHPLPQPEFCFACTSCDNALDDMEGRMSDNNFIKLINSGSMSYSGNRLVITKTGSDNAYIGIILHFDGIPSKFTFTLSNTVAACEVYESVSEPSTGTKGTLINRVTNGSNTLTFGSSESRYVMLYIAPGAISSFNITDICIKGAPSFLVSPAATYVNTDGNTTTPAAIYVQHYDLSQITITSDDPEFVVTPSALNSSHGLGENLKGTTDVSVDFTGTDYSKTATLTFTGTTSAGATIATTRTVTVGVNATHPEHYAYLYLGVASELGSGTVAVTRTGTAPAKAAYRNFADQLQYCAGEIGASDDLVFYLWPKAGDEFEFDDWYFDEGAESPATIVEAEGDKYKVTIHATSTDPAFPTIAELYANFTENLAQAPPIFTLEDPFDMGSIESGSGSLYKNMLLLPEGEHEKPLYIDRDNTTISFSDVTGHTGESQYFSAPNGYVSGLKGFGIVFNCTAPTPIEKTYEAWATVTASNDYCTDNSVEPTSVRVKVTATVTPAPLPSFTVPSSHTFADLQRNQTETWNATLSDITNMVGVPAISVTGTNAALFTAGEYDEETQSFPITFHPTAVGGPYNATATITIRNYDNVAETRNITLTGTCVIAPLATFDIHNQEDQEVSSSYFGDFYVGEAAYEQTFHIVNIQNMKVGSIPTVSIAPEGIFTAGTYNASTKSFGISFEAVDGMTSVQNAVATFTMLNNDDQPTTKTVSLSAFVVVEPDYDVEVTAADGTTVLKQGTWAECLDIANTAANAGCTMRLVKNVNLNTDGLTAAQEIKNTFTLDLNGKKLAFSRSGSVIYVNKAGVTLTVKDSKSGGAIENIGSFNTAAIYVFNVTAGNLIIKNGNFTVENTYAGKGAYAILQKAGTEITINGGTIKAIGETGVEAVNQASDKNDNTILTINNGELSAEGDNTIYGIDAYGRVTINGGTITAKLNGTAYASDVRGLYLRAYANATASECYHATLDMTGGTVNAINNYDHDDTHNAYGIFFYCSNAAMGTATATDGSHANKAAAVGTISNATINASTLGRYAYGVIAHGSYQSKTNTYDKIRINNSTINATANYYYSYGVYAHGGVNTTHGAVYAANIELTDCEVNAVTTKNATAYGVWATTFSNTVYRNTQPNYYGEYAGGATVSINSGTYTATTGTTSAYAVGTSARARTTYGVESNVAAERTLGGNAESYAILNINGGTFRANAGTSTARAVSNGGICTINGGEFYATSGTTTADGIYNVGHLTANGAKIVSTATTNTAYGIRTDVSDIPTGRQSWTGFTYRGESELNNLDVTVTTGSGNTAYGIYANAKATLYTEANFEAAMTQEDRDGNNYTIWKAVSQDQLGKAFADSAYVTVNGGTYNVTAETSTAYGAFSNTTAVSASKAKNASAVMDIKNATFKVKTNQTTEARGIYSSGLTTIDGCDITATSKTTNAYGVLVADKKTTVANTKITVTATNSDNTKAANAYGIYGTVDINATHAYKRYADIVLNEGNEVLAKTTSGTTAYALFLNATKRNIASGTWAGDYAVAAKATINGGIYTAQAAGTTGFALFVAAQQVQGTAVEQPELIVNDGKFKGTAASSYAEINTNGKAGHVVLNGGYYVSSANLNMYAAADKVVTALATTRTEYTEGYRYEIAPPGGNYVCQIGSTKYKTLEEALSVVTSGQTIYMIADYTMPAGDYILPSGATLLIPYTTTSGKGGTTAIGAAASTTTSATTPTLFRKLTFASGANLTSFGTIETSAQQKANGQYGANVGMASGPYGQLELNEGAHIEMESGANLYCWGFVTGKGTINVKKGANTLEGFQLGDWCGGTNASNLIGNSQKVFPITHYFFQSIECPITYRPGSTAKGSTHVNVSFFGVVGQDAVSLVGTSGAMFLMTNEDASADTWVMKDYDETTDQCVWTLNSGASIGNLTINISSYNMASKDYDLPIASNMSIVMNYGTMSIGQNAVFLPGSKLIVNKEGTLDINGVSVVAYDKEDWTGTTCYYASYSPSWGTTNPRKSIALQDAEFFVHGKIEISGNGGGVYTSAGGANIHSTNEDAGEIVYTSAATGNKTSYYLVQGGTNKTALTVNPARLRNGIADPAFSATASTIAGKTWIYYDDQWQCWEQDNYCFYRDNSDNPYAKPDGYVALNIQEADEDYASLIHDAATGTRGFIWDENCYWWEVNPIPVAEGVYQTIQPDHNGKYNYYEFNGNDWYWVKKNVTVTWNGDGVTTSNYTNVGYGTKPKWLGATPTKSGYIWDGWTIGGSGTVYTNDNLPEVTANTTFTSHFKSNPVKYNITFKNPDGKVLDSRNWESGSTPSYEGTPERDATVDKTYTWAGIWSPAISTVTAPKDYTAQYNEATRQYDVTFLDYDNTELETKKVDYNATPAYAGDPSTPTRVDPTDTWIYEFSGWKNQQTGTNGLAAVECDQTYVAQYNHHQKWFNVRFVDYNGTTLQTGPVLRNTMPTPPADPTRESDAQYHYTFNAWSPAIVTATANATYTATYHTTLRSYTIRFLNYNGDVLQTETLNYGVTPEYTGETPANADESLEFVGWDDVMRTVSGNKDYTAQYTKKTYTVTVTSEGNGSVSGSGSYTHGETATLTASPDDGYVFSQWNDGNTSNPRSLEVTETATYTATFVVDDTDLGPILDIVDVDNSGKTLTINASGWATSGWPYTVNDVAYGKNNTSGETKYREADRTLILPYGDKTPGENFTITVKNKSSETVSLHTYVIPQEITSATTLTAGQSKPIFVKGATLTIDGNISAQNIYVAPDAKLVVNAGKTLTADTVFLRTIPERAAELVYDGTISGEVYYTRIIKSKSGYFQFGLPLSCAISEVRLSNNGSAGYKTSSGWILRYYDEASRATNGPGENWATLDAAATIAAGKGYEMFSGVDYYREFYFPVDLAELSNTVNVAYTAGSQSVNNGWNVLVSPLTHTLSLDPKPEDITVNWMQLDGSFRQENPASIDPVKTFAYQTVKAGSITFGASSMTVSALAPRRRVAAAEEPERIQWIHMDVTNAEGEGDQTSVYSHPTRYEDSYKTGIDVAKQSLTASRAILYTSHAYGDMAFAGVADSLLESGIALTVYSPAAQELTFSLRENEWLNRLAQVLLIDHETGAQVDLLDSDYTFDAVEGTIRGRFTIMGRFLAPQITTDIEDTQSGEAIKARKLMIDQKIFIEVNGRLYDATGKLVNKK